MKGSMPNRTLAGVALVAFAAISWGAPAAGQTSTPPAAAPTAPAAPIGTPPPLSPNASPTPFALPSPQPVPSPITSLPPASQPSTLPYPAYGTPVPGVNRGVKTAAIPQVVSLEQAIAIGYARSPLLAQARATVLTDTAPVDLAKTAVLPDINGTATVGRVYSQNTGTSVITDNGSGTNTATGSTTRNGFNFGNAYTDSSFGVSLTQLVYDGGKIAAQFREAKATQSAALATYQRELQTVAYNVANAYYAALAAQRTTQVAVETVKINQVNANLVAAQIRAGTAARSDYLTAELPVAQARVALVQDQGAELSTQAAFVNAMGLDANIYVLPQDDGNVLAGSSGAPKVSTPTYDAAVARAYLLRPDYFAAQQSVKSYQYALRAAHLNNWPHIDANGSYSTASSDPQGGTFRNSGSIGLTLTVPIYDQGVTHADVEQAQGELDNAQALLNQTQQSVQLNVKQTLVSLVSAQAAFDQVQAELANAREVLAATQAQYAAGVTTLPLLLNAEVGLTTALAAQVNAVYTLRQAEAAFLYAEGANAPA
jgi:outer membrane protein TolC